MKLPILNRATATAPVRLILLGLCQGLLAVAVAIGGHTLLSGLEPDPAALIGLAGAVAVSALLVRAERIEAERIGQATAQEIRSLISRHILKLPMAGQATSAGSISLRYGGDLMAVASWLGRGRAEVIVGVPTVLAALGALGFLAPAAALAFAALCTITIGAQLAGGGRLRRAAATLRRARSKLVSRAVERFDARAAVQLFDRVEAESSRIDQRGEKVRDAALYRARAEGDLRAGAALGAGLFPVFALFVMYGDIAAAGAALMVGGLISPRLRALGRSWERYQLAKVALENIENLLGRGIVDERAGARGIARHEGRLALKNLVVTEGAAPLNAVIPAGSRVAVTGPNGVGKSRLLRAIAGLEAPAAGSIVIDGRDTGKRRLSSLRQRVSLAGADIPLVAGTFDKNLNYGARMPADEAQRVKAIAGIDTLLKTLPNGGQTPVGPRGEVLSTGQRARAALIRALLRSPTILLLDEIESPMDTEARIASEAALKDFPGTILRATHDPSVIADADVELRLDTAGSQLIFDINKQMQDIA